MLRYREEDMLFALLSLDRFYAEVDDLLISKFFSPLASVIPTKKQKPVLRHCTVSCVLKV